jgi:hypothetical protein
VSWLCHGKSPSKAGLIFATPGGVNALKSGDVVNGLNDPRLANGVQG